MMTDDNLIIIRGKHKSLRKELLQWIDLYKENLEKEAEFKLYKLANNDQVIIADETINNEYFFYLINYLNNREAIDTHFSVEAYTIGKEDNILKNQRLLAYFPLEEPSYDYVYVVTSNNRNYKVCLDGEIIESIAARHFAEAPSVVMDNPDIVRVNKQKSYLKKTRRPLNEVAQRFKKASIIFTALLLANTITYFIDKSIVSDCIMFLGMGLAFWYLFDYKMLQSDKYYFYCLAISVGFVAYGFLLRELTRDSNFEFVEFSTGYPLSLLILQKPTRAIFKRFLKREPIVDRPPTTQWDGIYTMLLLCGSSILPLIWIIFLS